GAGSIALNGTLNLIFSVSLANNSPIDLFLGPATNTGDFSAITLTGSGYSGTFTSHVGTLWTSTQGPQTLTFEASTGVLDAVPEPATWALLAFSLTTVMILRRHRNS
ncbi:MAG: PEP-CTERM sorting domain-containing protein, partial [Terrimicrobiaceae bacterium]